MKRPTDILVTMMEELYKNEWTDAFLELKKDNPDSNEETNIAQELVNILKAIFNYSSCVDACTSKLREEGFNVRLPAVDRDNL
ncbi:hypothetical protein DPMN_143489 [Dreissena polymorpha]|uniref:Uncharacterized protein n=1 Tax=Dreissena polymorpha TaxID=45954 RepID=A0A9D4JK33_DREPO|nr:hypothetical protein DPMN_143489 [Dreissena polymorpha]